ncbi:MAG TPA: MscL family protein [Candidatus Microsaccharimonas sp.]|nr:MscL family protein [Candidatus Microsaccharimonas sp.]
MTDEKQPEQEVIVVDKHGKRHKGVAMLLETDDVVREQVGGFSRFLQDYAVVGLALGFIVGQQANGVVKQFVATFLDPLVEFLFGQDLSDRVAIVHHHQQAVKIPLGAFAYALLEFFFVLITMYAVIKLFKLDKFIAKKKKKR